MVHELRKPSVSVDPEKSVMEVPRGPSTAAERGPKGIAVVPPAKPTRKKFARGAQPRGERRSPPVAPGPTGPGQAVPGEVLSKTQKSC